MLLPRARGRRSSTSSSRDGLRPTRPSKTDAGRPIAYFLPGDICDSNIFLIDEMDHSIGALTPLTVAEISRRGFEELAAEPRIHQALRWEGLVTAAIQREWTLSLGRRSALERMAHLFCELYMRLEAVGLTCHNSYELPITQTDLGEALGISTVHVNRTLQELRASDLIVFKERTLTILDFERLQRHAMLNPNYLHLGRKERHRDASEGDAPTRSGHKELRRG